MELVLSVIAWPSDVWCMCVSVHTHTLWAIHSASRVCWMCKCVCGSADKQLAAVHTGQSVCGSYLQRVSGPLQACDTRQLTQSNHCQPGLNEMTANPSDCANKQTVNTEGPFTLTVIKSYQKWTLMSFLHSSTLHNANKKMYLKFYNIYYL